MRFLVFPHLRKGANSYFLISLECKADVEYNHVPQTFALLHTYTTAYLA